MALGGELLDGGGLHGIPFLWSNWNTAVGSASPFRPWSQLLYPPETRVLGCREAERNPAAAAPMLGVVLVLANADEGDWRFSFLKR